MMPQSAPGKASNVEQQKSPPPFNNSQTSYQFKYHRFSGHCEFKSNQSGQTIHVESRGFSFHAPDVCLHDGPSTSHPVLAIAKFPNWSSKFKLGLGNYQNNADDMNSMRWETMTRDGLLDKTHTWSLPADSAGARTRMGPFVWREDKCWTYSKYVMQDKSTGQEMARYARNPGMKSGGALIIHASLGKDFDTMTMLTLVSIYIREKASNASNASWAGAAWTWAG